MSRQVLIQKVIHPTSIKYEKIGGRFIKLLEPVRIKIILGNQEGCYDLKLDKDFYSDGRSGPAFFDIFIPHIGSIENLVAVLVHDALTYDVGLSLEESNRVLDSLWKYFKRDGVSPTESTLAKLFTDGFGPARFGTINDEEVMNKTRVHFQWTDK